MPTTKESIFETFHIDEEGVDRVIEKIKALVEEGNAAVCWSRIARA